MNVAHANGGKNSFSRAPVVTAVFTQTKSLHSWLEGGILPVLGTWGLAVGGSGVNDSVTAHVYRVGSM